MSQQILLSIGAVGMALGALAIFVSGRSGRPEDNHHFTVSFFVCLIAFASYFAMAAGQGDTQVGERTIYFARYVDWLFTTPLLLLGLLLIALPRVGSGGDGRGRAGLVGGVIGADVFMILTGLIASLSSSEVTRYTWYAISCGAFLAVLALIYGPVRAAASAQGDQVSALFARLAAVLTVLWFVYPVLWLLGTEGLGVIGLTGEVLVFTVIDLAAKVGFGLLLVAGVKHLAVGPAAAIPATNAGRSSEPVGAR